MAKKKKSKTAYRFSPHYGAPVQAQTAGEELSRIESEHGGITPKLVVDESRPEEAPLHPVFEWNDETAAEEWRKDQASRLIRSVRCVSSDEERTDEGPAFVSVVSRESEQREYISTVKAMDDEEYRAQVLEDVIALLKGIQKRHRDLSELAGVWEALDAVTQPLAAV